MKLKRIYEWGTPKFVNLSEIVDRTFMSLDDIRSFLDNSGYDLVKDDIGVGTEYDSDELGWELGSGIMWDKLKQK